MKWQTMKTVLWSAVGGAIVWWVVLGVGFGWMPVGSAERQAAEQVQAALLDVRAPICVAKFNLDGDKEQKIEELKKSEKSIIRAFGDLQEARKKTIEERNKTLAIISNFIDPIIVIDQNSTINLLNPAFFDKIREISTIFLENMGLKIIFAKYLNSIYYNVLDIRISILFK